MSINREFDKEIEIPEEELADVVGGRLPSIYKEYLKYYDPSCGIPFEEWFWKEYEKDYPTLKK